MKAAKKPKLGRPPVPKKLAKAVLLSVRFSPGERARLDHIAKRQDQSVSEYARSALLATNLVFNDQFSLISSKPANWGDAMATAGAHLKGAGNAAYLYDFTQPGRATKVTRGAKPDETIEMAMAGDEFPVSLRRLERRP